MLGFTVSQATVSRYMPSPADGQHRVVADLIFAIKPVRSACIPRSGRTDTLACVFSHIGPSLVLFYVYPLKFFVNVFLVNVWLSPPTGTAMQISNGTHPVMTWGNVRGLLIIFGSGFAAIYLDVLQLWRG